MSHKLKMLFVDDMEVRHELLRRWSPRADCAYNYEQAVALLTRNKYDILSLDHDLSDQDIMCVPGEKTHARTGSDLATFIYLQRIPAELVILHTHNPTGADCMAAILRDAPLIKSVWRKPFGFDPDIYRKLEIA